MEKDRLVGPNTQRTFRSLISKKKEFIPVKKFPLAYQQETQG